MLVGAYSEMITIARGRLGTAWNIKDDIVAVNMDHRKHNSLMIMRQSCLMCYRCFRRLYNDINILEITLCNSKDPTFNIVVYYLSISHNSTFLPLLLLSLNLLPMKWSELKQTNFELISGE